MMSLKTRSKRWLVPLSFIGLVLATMALTMPTANAQEPEPEDEDNRNGIVGEVVSATIAEDGSGSFVVLTGDGEVTVNLTAGAYELKTPGTPSAASVAGTLEVGAKVAVLLEEGSAVQVLVKPTSPVIVPVTGSVVSVDENGLMTIATPSGQTRTVQLPPQANRPTVGELVTTFIDESTGTDDEDGGSGRPSTAIGLVRADEVRARLSRFLDEALQDATDTEDSGAGTDIDGLATLLDDFSTKHVERLNKILERDDLPAQAKAGMMRALDNAVRAQITAKGKADEARARGGRPPTTQGGRPDDSGGRPESPGGGNQGGNNGGGRPEGAGGGRP